MSSYVHDGHPNATSNSYAPVRVNDGTVEYNNPVDLRVGMMEYSNGLSTLLEPISQLGNLTASSGRKTIINSQIVGASINNIRQMIILPDSQLTNLTLWHIYKTNEKARCVYWNTSFK